MKQFLVGVLLLAVSLAVLPTVSSGAWFSDTAISQANIFQAGAGKNVGDGGEIKPETLNLKSKGNFTAFIWLLPGYDVADIDITTVECEGAPALRAEIIRGGEVSDTIRVIGE